MTEQANPYQAPHATSDGQRDSATPTKRFRWRVIPATLLFLYGGLLAVGSLFMLAYSLWWLCSHPDAGELGIGPTPDHMLASGVHLLGGGLLLLTGVQLMRGRWWEAALPFVVAVAMIIVANLLTPVS